MSNSYFKFKAFMVQQDRCGMKVSTDACIQGAWTPILPHVKRVLDVGAGTGLLSLMLAQRNEDIIIDAIELDADAAQQAMENIAASPWADRIHVIQGDASTYAFEQAYDLIICNPPFFQNNLPASEAKRNAARHSEQLTQENLARLFDRLLSEDGYASVLFPAPEHAKWEKWLKINETTIFNKLFIIPTEDKVPNRVVSLCKKGFIEEQALTYMAIRTSEGAYTAEFATLLSPFYLAL